jgi:Bacterial archaeo-eukaryotic release factor family 2
VVNALAGRPAYVAVAIDRAAAEITSVHGAGGASHTVTVVGPDDEIERNAPGGWSQPRYQRRAEDSWRHNAGAVLDAALQAARQVDTRMVLVAGDVRAVQLLQEQLGRHQHEPTIRHLPCGRSPDGSADARHSAIAAVIAEEVEKQNTRLLKRLRDEAGPVGLAAVRAALLTDADVWVIAHGHPDCPS